MFLRTQENSLVGIDFQHLVDVLTGHNVGLYTSRLNLLESLDVAAEAAVWVAGKSYVVERSHDNWLVSSLLAGVEIYQKQALKIKKFSISKGKSSYLYPINIM